MRRPSAAIAAALVVAGLAFVSVLGARQEAPFVHEEHAGLFPVCTGCHQGVETGDPTTEYPAPDQCSGCHDGVEFEQVTWTGPTERTSNVVFDHVEHVSELLAAGDSAATCESCHSDLGVARMAVDGGAQLATCWGCHAHERDDHYASMPADACASCHVPLAESGFGLDRLENLPTPEDHEHAAFLIEGHAEDVRSDDVRCSTCHTSDRCAACHVDASLDEIVAIPGAPEGMEQPVWSSEYPTPATHETIAFEANHEPDGGNPAECATCHTSDDCLSCHIEPAPHPVGDLVAREASRAPGVHLEVIPPETHESSFFMAAHANLAASDPGTCATCHTEAYCVACHDGPSDGGYHPPSFVSRHAADAWGRSSECASCHSTAAFCRECHEASGFGSVGRLSAGYHDAEPLWLLRHGGAARQNLESCASCHQQSDCVQCHGVLGSYRISPHTSDFDAEAAWAKSPRTCIACHTSNPLIGR
jgi:hypothetical protein